MSSYRHKVLKLEKGAYMAIHLPDNQKQEILQNAKVIVIVGLSPDASKASYQVASFLLEKGYEIVPIYPKGGYILGKQAYISLKEAFIAMAAKGLQCDIINVFRKSEALLEVVNSICALDGLSSFDKNKLCVWVQLGLQNKEAAQIAKNNGLAYEEDSCIKLEYQRIFNTHIS